MFIMEKITYLDDVQNNFVKIFSNPISLVLYAVGVAEFLSIFLGTETDIFTIIQKDLQDILELKPGPTVESIIKFLISFISFLYKNRKYFVTIYFALIPVVLQERDLIVAAIFEMFMFILVRLSILEKFIICQIWVLYNSLNSYHKFVLVILLVVMTYFGGIDLKEGSPVYDSIKTIFKPKI